MLLPGCTGEATSINLRVMSFNLWHGGDGCGLSRDSSVRFQLEAIRRSKADIVGFQEQTDNNNEGRAKLLADSLGWNCYVISGSRAVISKYPLTPLNVSAIQPDDHHGSAGSNPQAVLVRLDKTREIVFGVLHLMYTPYEPYDIADKKLTGREEAETSAAKTRLHEVQAMLMEIDPYRSQGLPVILVGDFNEPSCLDWTSDVIRQRKDTALGFPVNWPASRLLLDSGFEDAFRAIHPDARLKPGYTWTSRPGLWRVPEIHDRIDLIHTTKENLQPVNAWVVGEKSPMSDIVVEPWPSDHRAVVAELVIH
jgi:exonuclease III